MKKMYAFVLALACILSLAGCGRTMNSVIDNEPNFKGVVAEVRSVYKELHADRETGC